MGGALRNQPIARWREGDFVQGFAFLAKKEHRQDRKGSSYLHLELQDRTGTMVAKAWPDSQAVLGRFEAPSYVAFEGVVQRYRDELQLNVRRCRAAGVEDRSNGFDEAQLVPTTRENIDDLWARLLAALDGVERPPLRRLAVETLAHLGGALREHAAAKTIHHAYRGGLLEHVVSMSELMGKVCDHYRELDRDLLLLGVLFHDLGKVRELGVVPASEYTREGRLIGHVVLGRDLLRERCAAIPGFPPDLQLQLEHLVLSHQGTREFGSPVEPMTAEALVLHFVDDLDSKLEQLRRAGETASGFQFLRSLGRHVFLGDTPPALPEETPAEPRVEERVPVQVPLPGLLPGD
ncbi:MAG: 3'-5' exoribonuclease YhaM family protein [bacterium]